MASVHQSLVFTQTPVSLTVSVCFVAIVAFLAFETARRSGFRREMCALEALRVVIAIAIALTLNQPELQETALPENKPVLTVLADHSGSMNTEDVLDPDNPSRPAVARKEIVSRIENADLWAHLADRWDVAKEAFSSESNLPEEATDLNAALLKTVEKHPHLKAVVLLSDGDWNTGSPPSEAAVQMRLKDIRVFSIPIGSETRLPDVQLTGFDVPTFAIAGKPVRIPFTLESSLPREHTAVLEMTTSTGETVHKEVVIPAMGKLQDVLVWKTDRVGDLQLKLTVPPTGEERYLHNNTQEAPLSIRKEQLRVLLIETHPRWEFRYLRNALERDPGVQVECLLLHPDLASAGAGRGYLPAFPKDESLSGYDVVFVGDIGVGPSQLTPENCTSLQKLVRDQAAGLVFMPGLLGNEISLQETALGELLPIVWDTAQPRGWGSATPGRFALTDSGVHSLLTKLEDSEEANLRVWQNLPGFQWYAPAARAKAGTEVLATHETDRNKFGRIPLLATKTHGAGKILFMGTDGAWRWRKGVEDRYHYRFWGQVVRWMAYQRTMSKGDQMRLFYSPDRPRVDTVLTLNANVSSASGEPLRQGTVVAQITAPSGKTASVRLLAVGEDSWGLFSGTFSPAEAGEHRVRLQCAESASVLESVVSIQGMSREKLGQPIRSDVLREIAQLTRGKTLEATQAQELLQTLTALGTQEPQERRIPLWGHPLWAGFIVLLLGIFWIGRKTAGAF